MNRGSDDSSQALLNLSSLGSLEATLSKRGTGAGGATVTPAASTRRSGRASFDPSTLPSTEQAMRKRLSLSEDPASAEKWPGAGAFLSPSPSKAPVKRRPPSSDGAGFMSPPAAASFTPSAAASTPAPMLTPGGLSSTSSPPLSAGGATAYLNRTNAGQKAGKASEREALRAPAVVKWPAFSDSTLIPSSQRRRRVQRRARGAWEVRAQQATGGHALRHR